MDQRLAELLQVLDLEELELNLFRGESRDIGSPQVFGGQVLGQALMAASRTVEGRACHSLHAYFLRPGDFNAPIVYSVDRSRDGKSFSSRRVVAIQHGAQIFHMSASFQVEEQGFEHQATMPVVPGPEAVASLESFAHRFADRLPEATRRFFEHPRPFEFRPIDLPSYLDPTPRPARKAVWFRTVDRVPDTDPGLHRALLAYVSDYNLLDTAILPHGAADLNLQIASIDHALWFHRPFRADEWLLYSTDSPSASDARGLSRGMIFGADGRLIASSAQEGLLRVRTPPVNASPAT